MTNEGAVTFSFLIAIFIANFPEAFSGASLLLGQNMSVSRIPGVRALRAQDEFAKLVLPAACLIYFGQRGSGFFWVWGCSEHPHVFRFWALI